jgi:hypothetical protein
VRDDERYKKFLARVAREASKGYRERLKPTAIGMQDDGTLDLVADRTRRSRGTRSITGCGRSKTRSMSSHGGTCRSAASGWRARCCC